MKNWLVKNLLFTTAFASLAFSLVLSPFLAPDVHAAKCGDIETSIIGENGEDICEEGEGSGIWYILNLVLRILTWGVGILAVMGIVIAGIIYATAGGDEGKVRLAKTMIFNIAIGVVLYVLLYAILNFILPNTINSSGDGSTPLVESNQ